MARTDTVYVRKSTTPQEEKSQTDAIRQHLDRHHVHVPEDMWFSDTGSRHSSDKRAGFQKLMRLVEQDRIRVIYCWKQDRIGTNDSDEWGHVRWVCRTHGTKIIDTVNGRDLTAPDIATKIQTLVDADQSEQFQINLAQHVIKAKVRLAHEGMPMSKWPPFGYDKKYIDPKGTVLWTAHLLDSGRWLVIDPRGNEIEREKLPKKDKHDRITYVPSRAKDRPKIVRDIFRWYATESLTERTIALRLNKSGQTIYGNPWLRTTVRAMLRNPAYVGSVRNLHTTQATHATFDGTDYITLPNPGRRKKTTRPNPGATVVVADRHEALIPNGLWETVQSKLDTRAARPQPPRREDLWLRGVLYCGRCDQPMHVFTGNKKKGGVGGVHLWQLLPLPTTPLAAGRHRLSPQLGQPRPSRGPDPGPPGHLGGPAGHPRRGRDRLVESDV